MAREEKRPLTAALAVEAAREEQAERQRRLVEEARQKYAPGEHPLLPLEDFPDALAAAQRGGQGQSEPRIVWHRDAYGSVIPVTE